MSPKGIQVVSSLWVPRDMYTLSTWHPVKFSRGITRSHLKSNVVTFSPKMCSSKNSLNLSPSKTFFTASLLDGYLEIT